MPQLSIVRDGLLMDDSIYREQIIDLYENPLNQGSLEPADFSYEEDNPLCGDVIRIDVRLDAERRIADIGWTGQGCAISQAAASLLTEEVKGMTLEDVKALPKERLLELLGIPLSMQRVKCALLSFKVLKAGIYGLPDPKELRP
jgi:nitrogen fixation protein NifU and related proteins